MKKLPEKQKSKSGKDKKENKNFSKKRPSWDEYFLGMVDFVGLRGTCDRATSGCVIVKDKRVISTGYVGAPSCLPHCDEVGHEMHKVTNEDGSESMHCVRTTHAEQNAIAQSARFGIAIEGGTLYCRMTPCYTCAKIIISAGIKRVVAKNDYHKAERSKDIFKKAGIVLEVVNKEIEKYPNQ